MFSFSLAKKPVQQAAPIKKPNLFGDDDDDEAQTKSKLPHLTTQIAQISYSKVLDDTSNVLLEDPTIFSYDDHYDEINQKRQEIQEIKKQKAGSKYIGNLKKASEKRKIEQSMIHERIAEKELKREGDLSNGQKYVTSSFKKLMETGNQFLAEDQAKEEYNKLHGAQNEENVLGLYKELYQQDVFMGGFRPDLSTMITKDKNAPPAQKQEPQKSQEQTQPQPQAQPQESARKEASVSRHEQQRETERADKHSREERKYRDYDERPKRDYKREERTRSRSRSKSPRVKAPPKEEKEEEKVQKAVEVEKEKPLTKEEKLRLAKERYQQRKQNQAAAPNPEPEQ